MPIQVLERTRFKPTFTSEVPAVAAQVWEKSMSQFRSQPKFKFATKWSPHTREYT